MIEGYRCMDGFNKGNVDKVLVVKELCTTRGNGIKWDKHRFSKAMAATGSLIARWKGGAGWTSLK